MFCKTLFCLGTTELTRKSESASVTVDGVFEILKEKMKNSMQLFAEYPMSALRLL